MRSSKFLAAMLGLLACTALSACGGGSTDQLANPGNTGANPGIPNTGGATGGGTGGGGGGGTANCPSGTTTVAVGSEQHCRLPTQINSDITLIPGNVYQLNGRVDVGVNVLAAGGGQRATLTVLPGVFVYAATNNSYLVVNQGSRLVADGAVDRPIVFTSAADLDYDDDLALATQRASYRGIATGDVNGASRGEWGGITLNGLAPTNNPTRVGEGSTGTITGGTDANDNSGVIRYVQVRYAGFDVGLAVGGAAGENELNGLAFQAVGAGTTVQFVQVHNAFDDCFEMFGGTVNLRNVVCTGTNDDAYDWTDGWRGNIQFAIHVANPNFPTNDAGIEADNLSSAPDREPRSNPNLSNFTFVGTRAAGITASGGTALFRAGTAGKFVNSVIGGTRAAALDVDGSPSYAQATADQLIFRSLFLFSNPALATDADDGPLPGIFARDPNNAIGTGSLVPQVGGGIAYVNGPTENGRPAFNATSLSSFFSTVNYIGAVQSPSNNWTLGWTEFLNRAG
ncbi:MAG: hypothetical protein AVDCRST_MAG39-261 [uncultured Sphingomonadaceae bacterium]|uniref:Lipoprotein n=1 Tax=uncultured Sphingomonadaceae bacterium TaxID=169976 RepID=A0A6J4S6R1_9SPHN|nr:MAG: hypothetical protein AVDCRST_MAG39-261 [uncultured Sphingomonadaceae bacterium]